MKQSLNELPQNRVKIEKIFNNEIKVLPIFLLPVPELHVYFHIYPLFKNERLYKNYLKLHFKKRNTGTKQAF